MTAKEMFKKLGYYRIATKTKIIFSDSDNHNVVEFRIDYHRDYNCFPKVIKLELHQAITKQLKELGWIE